MSPERQQSASTVPEIERTLLGGALSMEFSDCSIAAADLSKKASEYMQSALHNKRKSPSIVNTYVIGGSEDSQRLLCEPLDIYREDAISLYGHATRLVLAQPVSTSTSITKVPKRFLSKTEAKATVNVLEDNPILAVKIGNDTLLPIASFARRKNGHCSYVQLGQEMYDDNFYVTTADDESSRHGLIEAMRNLVKGFSENVERDAAYGVIQRFINHQAELQHAPLAQAYEHQFARHILAKVNDRIRRQQKYLTIIGDTHAATPELHDIVTIVPRTILADNRQVALLAACPAKNQEDSDRVGIFAETRSGVSIQIATISANLLQLEYEKEVKLTPAQHEHIVRELLFTLIARPQVKYIETSQEEHYNKQDLNEIDQQVANYCFQAHMLNEYEQYNGGRSYVPLTQKVCQKLDNFFDYPDREYSPYPIAESSPLNLALSRLEKLRTNDRFIFAALGVSERFERLLGETRKCDEVLMHYVAKLALEKQGFQSEFENEQIGKTKAAATVAAQVEIYDGAHELTISGRPASMPDEELKPLIGVTIDQTKPYLGQEKAIANGFSELNVKEIIGILSRLSVAHRVQRNY